MFVNSILNGNGWLEYSTVCENSTLQHKMEHKIVGDYTELLELNISLWIGCCLSDRLVDFGVFTVVVAVGRAAGIEAWITRI